MRYLQLTSETPKHDNADNLKKRLNDLLYTIQKATSDKLEMIRDTSTYEYNFAQANELTVQLARMRITAKSLPELESLIDGTFSENSTCEKIEKCLNAIISLENLPETHYEPEIEKYNIRKCFKVNKLDTVFQGVISVSGHNCMTNIRSDQ